MSVYSGLDLDFVRHVLVDLWFGMFCIHNSLSKLPQSSLHVDKKQPHSDVVGWGKVLESGTLARYRTQAAKARQIPRCSLAGILMRSADHRSHLRRRKHGNRTWRDCISTCVKGKARVVCREQSSSSDNWLMDSKLPYCS